ncbi:MAG TPA: ATP-binding protein [Stellaceae bacterium]|nr:ATP-binding protein [Stellaceae bacterium]
MATIDADHPSLAARVSGWFGRGSRNRADAIQERPRRRLTWPLRGLLAASLAVPLFLLAIAAGQNFRFVQRQAEQRVMIEAGELHEQALDALKTYVTVLAWIDARTRGLDWDRIDHDEELHRFLSDLDTLPPIDEVWMADAAGHPRVSGRASPIPPIGVSDRDCFAAEQEQDVGIFVGREQIGALVHAPEFDICERRSTPDKRFNGIIVVSAKPAYFSEFYRTVSQDQRFSASLVRSDGSMLVRYPTLPAPLVFARDSPFMQAIAGAPDHGLFRGRGEADGVRRFYAYQRIEGYPLYVTYGIPQHDVIASWRANLVNYSLFAVPASLALFGMTLVAVRQIQRHKIASWRWRTTARRLRREMNRRAQAEAELRQAQKMEALGQLTGGVAHDFNNLLTVLQGSLEMLSGRQKNDQLQARVDMALRTVERGERLTGQLLAFARRQPLSRATIELNAELQGMTELLTRTVGSGVAIRTDLAPDLWPVEADATQLELAVINLAINARDAMPAGGELRLRTLNRVSLAGEASEQVANAGDFVGLEISDTGMGMPPEVAARAFEPFFTTKEAGKGTGLGLSMVYGFARQSGGSVSIRSEVGRGTAVTLLLPRGRPASETSGAGATHLPQGASA